MTAIQYRKGTIADLDILLELMQEFYTYEQFPLQEDAARSALAELLADERYGWVWLMEQNGMVLGYVVVTLGYSLEHLGKDAFIDELYLRSPYRRQGIGSKTLSFVEEQCRHLGVQSLHLEVEHKNLKAQQFYRSVGYQTQERSLMTKRLLA